MMAKLVTVTAKRGFLYHGHVVERGQPVQMIPIDAAVHARKGDVSLTKKSAQTYRTRDLVAERPAVAVEPTPTGRRRRRNNPSAGEPRKRGSYRRRDVVAESPTE